jgi:uncharacterized protein YbaR (Trm112 family)
MFNIDMPMRLRDLWFLLFGKKRCPACAAPLERMTKTRDEGFGWHRDGSDFEYAHRTRVEFEYGCRRCRKWYRLPELVDLLDGKQAR